jgi:hypothetical protein
MAYSRRDTRFNRLKQIGLRHLNQIGFIKRVNLTFRQCVSSLLRRTSAYVQDGDS